jgi:hypothetical protein
VRAHGGCRLPGYTASALACLTAFLMSVGAPQKVTSSFARLSKPATQGRALPSDPRRRRAGTLLSFFVTDWPLTKSGVPGLVPLYVHRLPVFGASKC